MPDLLGNPWGVTRVGACLVRGEDNKRALHLATRITTVAPVRTINLAGVGVPSRTLLAEVYRLTALGRAVVVIASSAPPRGLLLVLVGVAC